MASIGSLGTSLGLSVVRSSCMQTVKGDVRESIPCLVLLHRADAHSAVMQEPPALRAIIAASAAATLLYTPVLKRLTLIKNVAVASVIALTPLTGALALGQVHQPWAATPLAPRGNRLAFWRRPCRCLVSTVQAMTTIGCAEGLQCAHTYLSSVGDACLYLVRLRERTRPRVGMN